jgi:hypothetical protein
MSDRYPFRHLRIGESATVQDVPSRSTISGALKKWRDALTGPRGQLGYTRDNCPQFHISWDPAREVAAITRLHDGPIVLGRKHTLEKLEANDPRAPERAWLRDRLWERYERAGDGQCTPQDVLERARAFEPGLANCFLLLERANPQTDVDTTSAWLDEMAAAFAHGRHVLAWPECKD